MARHAGVRPRGRWHGWSRRRGRRARAAYTLLELLIVSVLLAVLMASVWLLLRNWSRLYARGEQRALQVQLVRSLCNRFTDDLQAVAQTTGSETRRDRPQTAPLAPTAGRRAPSPGNRALVGGADWLALEVIQPVNPWALADAEPANEAGAYGAAERAARSAPIAPEVRHVLYTFTPPEPEVSDSLSPVVDELAAEDDVELVVGEEADQAPPSAGLLRLAIAHESSLVSSGRASGASSSGSREEAFHVREQVVGSAGTDAGPDDARALEVGLRAAPSEHGVESHHGAVADRDPEAGILERDEVPEVVEFELRYYDGSSWQSDWDSGVQGRLPVAIEMRFTLQESEYRCVVFLEAKGAL